MAIRRTDIDIIIPSATYQQKNDIPVWDAYIEKVVIDGDIPSLISEFNFDFLDGNRNIKAYESYERGDWIYYVKDVNHGYLIYQKLVGVIFGLYQ